jgi:hypothetical protein
LNGTLGEKKIAVLRDLLSLGVPDFLGILDRAAHENSNSDVLSWLLNPRMAPTIAPAALASLVSRLPDAEEWRTRIGASLEDESLCIRREYTIGREWHKEDGLDRIDIVISGWDFILAIENKLMASEHREQTKRYSAWLQRLPGRVVKAGLFLSPTGRPAAATDFSSMSYLDMLSVLLEGPVKSPPMPPERMVLAAYVGTLTTGVLRAEWRSAAQDKGGQNRE